jgi:hypothetical protein
VSIAQFEDHEVMRQPKAPASASLVGLFAFALLSVSGCGGGTGEISGTVRFQGQPLSSGFVTFTIASDPGNRFSATIGADGTYRIAACPSGSARIAVKAVVPRGGQSPPGKEKHTGDGPPAIPARYANPETSGLELTVRPGSQQHDIELVP